MPLNGEAILDGFDARRRNVHNNEARPEIGGQGLEPLDIDLELVAPRRRRHVHLSERHLAQNAIDGKPVAGLKAAHRLLDIGIVDVVADRVRIEVAGDLKPRPQIDHAGVPGAEPQFIDLGHFRPAAARNNVVIGLDGNFGELFGRRRQRRRGRLGHMDGARGLVEGLAELAPVSVVNERIERLVVG